MYIYILKRIVDIRNFIFVIAGIRHGRQQTYKVGRNFFVMFHSLRLVRCGTQLGINAFAQS